MHKSLIVIALFFSTELLATSKHQIDDVHHHIYDLLDTNLDSADLLSDEALAQSEAISYLWGEGNSLFLKGYIAKLRNEQSQAMIYYLKAINILETIDTEKAIKTRIKLYTNCGSILEDHYKYDEAIDYYSRAIDLAKENDEQKRLLVAYYNRSSAYQEKGLYSKAIEDGASALKLSHELEDEYMTVYSLNLLGIIYMESNKLQEAKGYYQDIVNFSFEELEPDEYVGRAYHNLANCYSKEGDYKEAEQLYLQSIHRRQLHGDPEGLFLSYMDLADLYMKVNEPTQSKEFGLKAEKLYDKMPLKSDSYKIFDILRQSHFALGQHLAANQYASRYLSENQKFLQEQVSIIQLQEQFTMDLVLAGFQQEVSRSEEITLLHVYIWAAIGVFLLILAGGYLRVIYVRKAIKLKIEAINEDTFI